MDGAASAGPSPPQPSGTGPVPKVPLRRNVDGFLIGKCLDCWKRQERYYNFWAVLEGIVGLTSSVLVCLCRAC